MFFIICIVLGSFIGLFAYAKVNPDGESRSLLVFIGIVGGLFGGMLGLVLIGTLLWSVLLAVLGAIAALAFYHMIIPGTA